MPRHPRVHAQRLLYHVMARGNDGRTMEQRCTGTLQVWAEPFTRLRLPKIFNLRTDPYEREDITSNTYYDWLIHNMHFLFAAQTAAGMFAATFKDFPPAQRPGSFTIGEALSKMSEVAAGSS